MFICISICITLLTIIAGMHLILKSNVPGVSKLFKWISYLIVLAGFGVFCCQVCCGIHKMCRHHGDNDCKEECHPWMRCNPGMMGGMHGCMMGSHGGMKCCDMDEKECSDMKMKCEGDSTYAKMECKGMMGKEDGEKEEHEKKEEKK